jgi:hypothetical protein
LVDCLFTLFFQPASQPASHPASWMFLDTRHQTASL